MNAPDGSSAPAASAPPQPLQILGLTSDELAAAARTLMPAGHGVAPRLYPLAFSTGRMAIDDFPVAAGTGATWRAHFAVSLLPVASLAEEPSAFGTTSKAILRTADNYEIECVRIPMRSAHRAHAAAAAARAAETVEVGDEAAEEAADGDESDVDVEHDDTIYYTLCISSQVGCKMGCTFCETGRMGLLRNLSAAEIVAQVVTAQVTLGWHIRNIVFMGMGEALDNVENVIQAVNVLSDRRGLRYGLDRITICTSGHAEGLLRLQAQQWKRLNLSISLNAATDAQRSRIMPVNRKTPLAALQAILIGYPQRRNFTLGVNYCLMPGLNDARADATAIAEFCKPLGRVLINLIPYNPGNLPLTRAPEEDEIVQFVGWLRADGLPVRRRMTKGRTIMAACGQLGNAELRKKKTPVELPHP
ncbi:MAG: radical SAM protein [Planctomycetes bacterium]|nr:radical SAM protein [Planctomycetota bacterium]